MLILNWTIKETDNINLIGKDGCKKKKHSLKWLCFFCVWKY